MKKNLLLKRMLLSMAALAGAGAMYALDFTQGALKYTVTSGTEVSVACVNKNSTDPMVIPSTVVNDGVTYTVTTIKNDNFQGAQMSALTIPATVKNIDAYTFQNCAMTTITFEDGIKLSTIKDHTFKQCKNVKELVIPEGVSTIQGWALEHMDGLESLTLPSTLATVDDGAFAWIGNNPSITSSVTVKAFTPPTTSGTPFRDLNYAACMLYVPQQSVDDYKSSKLFSPFGDNIVGVDMGENTVTFPTTGVVIDGLKYMLNGDRETVNVQVNNTSAAFDAVIPASIVYDGTNYPVSQIADKGFQQSKVLSVTIAEGITSIGTYAFQNAKGITSITIPASVSEIGSSAFQYCEGLTSITFAAGSKLSVVNNHVFNNCSKVTELVIPEGVISLGEWSLENMKGLQSLTLPSTMQTLNSGCLARCTSLISLTINATTPPTVKNSNVFEGTSIAECDLFVPESAVSTYKAAQYYKDFANMSDGVVIGILKYDPNADGTTASVSITNTNATDAVEILSEVTINGKQYTVTAIAPSGFENSHVKNVTIPNTVTTFGNRAFCHAYGLVSIVIPASVEDLGQETFRWCENVLLSIEFEKGSKVTALQNYTFNGCRKVTELTIPEGVTSIGKWVFENMASMTTLTLPSTLANINEYSFQGCNACETVKIYAEVPPTVVNANNTFNSFPTSTCKLLVPQGKKEAYAAAPAWSKFGNIEEIVETGVDVVVDSADSTPVYYNLMGVKVENPESGLYIVVKDGKASKVYVK